MNYRRRSKAFHVAVVRHVSQTCRREKAARVDRSMHSLPRYRLSLDLRVLARLETNRRRYVRLEEIARKTGLSPRYRSSCTRRPIYSLSLSLSLEDPRWICARWRNRGPIFTGELAYSIRWDREEGEEARGDRETRARAIFISRRAKWKRHRAFRAPRASQARELLVASIGRAILFLSFSRLEKNFEFHPSSKKMKRKSLFRELKRIKRKGEGKKFRESIRIGSQGRYRCKKRI